MGNAAGEKRSWEEGDKQYGQGYESKWPRTDKGKGYSKGKQGKEKGKEGKEKGKDGKSKGKDKKPWERQFLKPWETNRQALAAAKEASYPQVQAVQALTPVAHVSATTAAPLTMSNPYAML